MTGYQSKRAAASAKTIDEVNWVDHEPDGRRATQERQWIWLSDSDIAEVIDTTCQYTGGYEEYLIKKAERKIRSMNNG